MAAKTVNVGLIGTKFMGKAHSNAYLTVGKFFDPDPAPVMDEMARVLRREAQS